MHVKWLCQTARLFVQPVLHLVLALAGEALLVLGSMASVADGRSPHRLLSTAQAATADPSAAVDAPDVGSSVGFERAWSAEGRVEPSPRSVRDSALSRPFTATSVAHSDLRVGS